MTPTITLTNMARSMSVHQLGAFHIAAQVFKIYKSKKPDYHHSRLFNNPQSTLDHVTVRSQNNLQTRINFNLSTCRGSFFYQGAKMWLALPMSVKNSGNAEQFSRRCKAWIRTYLLAQITCLLACLLVSLLASMPLSWLACLLRNLLHHFLHQKQEQVMVSTGL